MTSGQFAHVPVDSIIVDRSKRQRTDLPDLTELKQSIRDRGLIHPIVVTRELELVAGECRLQSFKELGRTTIPVHYTDELPHEELHLIELEENVKRAALPWQDECRAVREYHLLRKAAEPEWTQENTADALGMARQTVMDKLQVAEELVNGNSMVVEAPRYSTARGIVDRAAARKDEAALQALQKFKTPETEKAPDAIEVADFNEWAPLYEGPKFNFIHMDFPYGIDANKFNQGAAPSHGGYSDTADDYWRLCTTLVRTLDRIASQSCHFMFWFSMHYYHDTLEFFEQHSDIKFDPFPLIWTKSDNVGILPDPERGPRRIYETCLFGARGDRKIVRATSNSVAWASERDQHMSIKPQGMLERFFTMFVDSNTLMLDPTAGSGGALRAAEALGARLVHGLERDPEFAARANLAMNKFRMNRKEKKDAGDVRDSGWESGSPNNP